jgi:hypothetical protein
VVKKHSKALGTTSRREPLYAALGARECRPPDITRLSRSHAKVVFLSTSIGLWARAVPGIRPALEPGTEKSNNQKRIIP